VYALSILNQRMPIAAVSTGDHVGLTTTAARRSYLTFHFDETTTGR
jgi:hypothetical protein